MSTPSITDKILRSRGDVPSHMKTDGSNEPDYVAFRPTGSHPEMSFKINYQRNGFTHQEQIYFHNMGNPRFRQGANEEYVNFISQGLAVQIRGRNIQGLLPVLGDCTLSEITEFDYRLDYQLAEGEPVITRVSVQDLNPPPKFDDAKSDERT